MNEKKTEAKKSTTPRKPRAKKKVEEITPLLASLDESIASTTNTRSRRNLSSTIERTDRFKNISDGLTPFKSSTYGETTNIDIREAVILCQKAYYNFAIFRSTIDMMTEFSVSPIYYKGGTKRSRQFFEALFNKINVWDLQDKFFREYYRSGNVFLYRFDAKLKTADIRKIIQLFGEKGHKPGEISLDNNDKNDFKVKKMIVPSRYVVLNPADVQMTGNISFSQAQYKKVLTDYELQRLAHPQTDEDVEVIKTFSPKIQQQIKDKKISMLSIPLDPAKFISVFYKKQDYEPFAVPMGFPVLEDLSFKAEMKKMDMAIARTMQQAILLVTMGADPDKGGINQKNLAAMQSLFTNQSVGRVLISDYTTKAEFVIPQIGDLLDSKKYDVIDRDINLGLNNLFTGGEKFANQQTKVEVFLARLEQARAAFVNDFLMTEIKRISKSLGFKNYPTPYFEEISLRDNVVKDRIYSRLLELGILTPQEAFKAIDSGILPDQEASLKNQKEYKTQREEGLFLPLMGGSQGEKSGSSAPGRPPGSGGEPQSNPSNQQRIGVTNSSEENYDFSKIKESMILSQKLEQSVASHLRKKHGVKRLNKSQKEICNEICNIIVANENSSNWEENVEKYCEKPEDTNKERVKKIQEISHKHQIDYYLASILYSSKV
jgi:hypothetical protein